MRLLARDGRRFEQLWAALWLQPGGSHCSERVKHLREQGGEVKITDLKLQQALQDTVNFSNCSTALNKAWPLTAAHREKLLLFLHMGNWE